MHFKKDTIVGLALALSLAGCKSGPRINECILTYSPGHDPVADCIDPNKKAFIRQGAELDGMYLYSPKDRTDILKWAKANCGSNDKLVYGVSPEPTPSPSPSTLVK
jgi:hypothetical protein